MKQPPSQIIQTSCGRIEYALQGKGAAILLCHGTGGGYDQGLMLAKFMNGFQGIAFSRAGYLGTPLETGPSPAKMADAYAALLDSLNIKKAAILGVSAGGMSAAYFAMKYPGRCWGLVLADAITKAPPKSSLKIVERINALPDAVAWFITRLAIHAGLPLMVRDAKTRAMMRVFFENNPISERHAGIQNDLENIHSMDDFPWEEIYVPTLLIHGDKDNLIPLKYSQEVAELIVVQGGGHECLVSHRQEISPILNAFLARHIPE
jgi:pimeloyl-ACP methyl ester carboxylesterase